MVGVVSVRPRCLSGLGHSSRRGTERPTMRKLLEHGRDGEMGKHGTSKRRSKGHLTQGDSRKQLGDLLFRFPQIANRPAYHLTKSYPHPSIQNDGVFMRRDRSVRPISEAIPITGEEDECIPSATRHLPFPSAFLSLYVVLFAVKGRP